MAQQLAPAHLGGAVCHQLCLSRNETATLVEHALKEVVEALLRGEQVKLSSFGTFLVQAKGGRIARNPKTGQAVPLSPRKVLLFRPSHVLKDQINAGVGTGAT